jgi:hypothetical protein
VNRRQLLNRIQSGARANVAFGDFEDLLVGLGFSLKRIRGSHYSYQHPLVAENMNLQSRKGQAKPYQVGQLVRIVSEYNLKLED